MKLPRETTLVRHDLVPRLLPVRRILPLTPGMVRVTLGGAALDGFAHAAPDDHVKLFFPEPGAVLPVLPRVGPDGLLPPAPGAARPTSRDYTVRHLRRDAREIDIDFVLHGPGPGAQWAARARPGHLLGVLGPRGSYLRPRDYDWYLFAGDETALPAIAAWLEWAPAGVPVRAFIEVSGPAEEQTLAGTADVVWLHRERGSGTDLLARAVRAAPLPPGDGFAWIAGEAGAVAPIRRYLRERIGRDRVEVDGYWRRGVADHDHHLPAED